MEPQKTIVQSIALGDTKTTSALQVTKSYRIEGAGLGTTAENDLMLNDNAINSSVWNDQTIEFTIRRARQRVIIPSASENGQQMKF